MKYRRTETVTETKLLLIKTKKENMRLDRCGECALPTLWLAPPIAAELLCATERDIYRLIETGILHFTEARDGEPKICSRSLMEILNK